MIDANDIEPVKPTAIPGRDIAMIICAAQMASISGKREPWKFLVVRDKDKITALKEVCLKEAMGRFADRQDKTESREQYADRCQSRFGNYFSAPVCIVVLTGDKSSCPNGHHWDGPLAAGHLMLAARALGYGTAFITDTIPDRMTREILGIPDQFTRVCITPVGIPFGRPGSPPLQELDELVVCETPWTPSG